MDTAEATKLMDAIAAAGDPVVLRFATNCMALLEANGTVTLDDVEEFATKQGLL
jgi:hypothetical protein